MQGINYNSKKGKSWHTLDRYYQLFQFYVQSSPKRTYLFPIVKTEGDIVFYAADCIKLLVALETESISEPLNIQQVIAYVLTSLIMDKCSIQSSSVELGPNSDSVTWNL